MDSPLVLYMNPVDGQDHNLGLSKEQAVKTATGLSAAIRTMDDGPEIIMLWVVELGRWVRL